ncbi:MAG: hypothetical protein ACKORL_11120, partial [Phycisphaerales bacterium]
MPSANHSVARRRRSPYGSDADLRSASLPYGDLRRRATDWFAEGMDRVTLDLGGPPPESSVVPELMSTEARLV